MLPVGRARMGRTRLALRTLDPRGPRTVGLWRRAPDRPGPDARVPDRHRRVPAGPRRIRGGLRSPGPRAAGAGRGEPADGAGRVANAALADAPRSVGLPRAGGGLRRGDRHDGRARLRRDGRGRPTARRDRRARLRRIRPLGGTRSLRRPGLQQRCLGAAALLRRPARPGLDGRDPGRPLNGRDAPSPPPSGSRRSGRLRGSRARLPRDSAH